MRTRVSLLTLLCPGVRLRATDLAANTRDWDVRGGLMETNVLKMQEIEAGEMP